MKKIAFLLFLLLIGSSVVYSEEIKVKVGGVLYRIDIVNEKAAVGQNFVVTSSSEKQIQGTLAGDIVIASNIEYNGKLYPVTSISPYAFNECNKLVSVTIPASVNEIDDRAFNYYLPDLKQIIVSPENSHFQSADGLLFSKDMKHLIRYPTGRSDTTYTVPLSVESIEYGAFSSCETLKHIVLSDNVKYIRNNAFEFCMFETIVLSEKMVEIGDNAFNYCMHLSSVKIPCRIDKVGSKAFSNCYNLQYLLCQNEHLTFPSDAFDGCVKFPKIVYETPVPVLIESAQKGDSERQYRLAMKYLKGEGVQKDISSAKGWFEKSAGNGYVPSQMALGELYSKGEEVEKNITEAIKWYSMAAKDSSAFACRFLGDCFFDGVGVKQDLTVALKDYKAAAGHGDSYSKKKLGYMYYYGKGVAKDYHEAGKWYLEVAGKGDTESAYYVALMMFEGNGLEKNDAEALKWAEKAVTGGMEEKCQWLYCELAYRDAVNSMESGYYSLAIARFTSMLAYDKKNADVYINRGYCYLNLTPGDYANAEADFKKALELNNDNQIVKDNLQIVYEHNKRIADFKLFCDNGDSYFLAKDFVNAVANYSKAISLDGTKPYPYCCIGYCYFACEQYADALGFFDKAVLLDPDYADAIKARKNTKIIMISKAISNAANSFSDSLNKAYNNSEVYDHSSEYNGSSGSDSYQNHVVGSTVKREQQYGKDKYNMYMRLYEQEQSEANSYFKNYEIYGHIDDLQKSKDCQSRANDYLEKANIWK